MATCERCGTELVEARGCSYCDGTYCGDHRLPENHDCGGVRNWEYDGGRFDSGFDDAE